MSFSIGDTKFCPYGRLSWITPIMAFFALWLFLFPAFRCSLTVSKPPDTDAEIFVGYWKREDPTLAYANIGNDGNFCHAWLNKDFFDGKWKFGRGVSVLGAMTCPMATALDIGLIFMRFPLSSVLTPAVVLHFVNATLSALLLVGLASYTCDIQYCQMARGAYVAIVACVFWLILTYMLWLIRKKEQAMVEEETPGDDDDDDEDYIPRSKPPSETEPDIEQPLALPAPQPAQQPKSPRRKTNHEPRLALPSSETSPRRPRQQQQPQPQPSSPRKPKKKNNTHMEEPPLALPMSSSPRKHPRKKNTNVVNKEEEESSSSPLALPMSENSSQRRTKSQRSTTKKKTKKDSGDSTSQAAAASSVSAPLSPTKKKKTTTAAAKKKAAKGESSPPSSTKKKEDGEKPVGRKKKRTPKN